MIFSRLPHANLVGVRQHVDNVALEANRELVESRVHADMRHMLAAQLVKVCATTTRKEFSTEYAVDLYVFPPDEFHKIVQKAAHELMYFLTPRSPR